MLRYIIVVNDLNKLGQPPLLVLNKGDIFDDLECVEVITKFSDTKHYLTKYRMRCKKCGREKIMLPSSIRNHIGTTHKACGKGIKTKYPIFYNRWQAMRTRTAIKSIKDTPSFESTSNI